MRPDPERLKGVEGESATGRDRRERVQKIFFNLLLSLDRGGVIKFVFLIGRRAEG